MTFGLRLRTVLRCERGCYPLPAQHAEATILTRIDHVTIGVPDLKSGIDAYRRIGFDVGEDGLARMERDHIELVRGREGIQSIALASDALARDSARGSAEYVKLVERKKTKTETRHPNGVLRIERVYIAVPDLQAAIEKYSPVLDMKPKIERGTVIMADMAIYQLGENGFGLAQPVAPGICAEAIERRGPGPFQILYRTRSMDAAAKWIADHGLPPPARGIRNTGEQAMLVGPEHACGVYVGFVGLA
jgi:catechol 2,3-dioxygenase-like lactoylglutathione lyase family enzyme